MTEFHALTKMDIAAIRQCDHLVVRSDPKAAVYATKKLKRQENAPFAPEEAIYTMPIPVRIADTWRLDTSDAMAFEMLWNFPTQITQLGCIFATLKVGDEVALVFEADGHSTQAMQEAGFHADVLKMTVRRGGKHVAEWELAVSVCENNSARMVKGAVKRTPVDA